jgi:thioredoxin reductase (NADPH)
VPVVAGCGPTWKAVPSCSERSIIPDMSVTESPREVDCLVVGGGVAGLSAALNMARMRRSVLLVDERDRFAWKHVAYNYLGFPNGISPTELRRLGWRQAAKYGVELLLGHVATIARDDDRFAVRVERLAEGGPWGGGHAQSVPRDPEMAGIFGEVPAGEPLELVVRSVILATGVQGHFPEFPGRDECVGKSLFWCIHCDGYESIDRIVAVVGHTEDAVSTALDLLEFTGHVTMVAGRPEGFEVPDERLADLAAAGIATYSCGVSEYESRDGEMLGLVLDDVGRTRIPVEHLYTVRRTTAANVLARQLGLELNVIGQIVVTSEQHTNVPGVYAAGDATNLHDHQLSAAAHEGNQAACGANYHLYRPAQK